MFGSLDFTDEGEIGMGVKWTIFRGDEQDEDYGTVSGLNF